MILKDVGMGPAYHQVCAFVLNDNLNELLKECPEIEKATHAVLYGYFDQEKGPMFEVLCAGKQAVKYFYFKAPYTGARISISALQLEDVEFDVYEDLEPRFRKPFESRIQELHVSDSEEEKAKMQDAFWSMLIASHLPEELKDALVQEGLTVENLLDGSFIKNYIHVFRKNIKDTDCWAKLLALLRSTVVAQPFNLILSEEAQKICERCKAEGIDLNSLQGEDAEKLERGISWEPTILSNQSHQFIPVFTSVDEMDERLGSDKHEFITFESVMCSILENESDIEGIVVNPYTDNFIISRALFGAILSIDPFYFDEAVVSEREDLYDNGSEIQHFATEIGEVLEVTVNLVGAYQYALCQAKVSPIQNFMIWNQSNQTFDQLHVRISMESEYCEPYEFDIPSLPSGKQLKIHEPHLMMSAKHLAEMTESAQVEVTIEIFMEEALIRGVKCRLEMLAYDQFVMMDGYRHLLPSFVMPTHPVISTLMHDAADCLASWGKDPILEGYQSHEPERVRELAAAAFAAIQKKNIVYAEPPKNFDNYCQQVRTPEVIIEQRLGTCMDMTLLYAALVEAIGLHPLLVIIEGHIFAGVWLRNRTKDEIKKSIPVIDDVEQMVMRFGNGADEMTFVECTRMCAGNTIEFTEAELIAKSHFNDRDEFKHAVDVAVTRCQGIRPMPSRVHENGKILIDIKEKEIHEVTSAPNELGITHVQLEPVKKKKMSKRELWENKLLDISSKNMLIKVPSSVAIVPFFTSHVDELEDKLADGHTFELRAVPDVLVQTKIPVVDEKTGKERQVSLLTDILTRFGTYEVPQFDFLDYVRQEYKSHRLYSFVSESQLDRSLTNLYRASRSAQQENGVSSLFMTIGMLRWYEEGEKMPSYAPLVLVPVELVRKSANQGFVLRARDEESRFNTTLLEMLKQNFGIEIAGLDPLPKDEHGLDIKKVFAIVRNAIFSVTAWDVCDACAIGNFSFAQFAMWNDIHTADDNLDCNHIVRSLMKGYVDWNVTKGEDVDDQPVYLPITVDATQLRAIQMAALGESFVLHGPPGTGKSQTITAMIANLMAQGKRVLFVAEKMAALSVVQKRLEALGLGDFCLELHSGKTANKVVLGQLNRALSVKRIQMNTYYEECQQEFEISRTKLDKYATHLHKKQLCGMSLRELIALYETVRDEEQYIKFNHEDAGKMTKDMVQKHITLIEQLIAAGAMVDETEEKMLSSVGITSYTAEFRSGIRRYLANYRNSIDEARQSSEKVAELLGISAPKNIDDFEKLNGLLKVYFDYEGKEPITLELLNSIPEDVHHYMDQKLEIDSYEKMLLTTWNESFLDMDVTVYLAKYESINKKIFGKSNAKMNFVVELDQFAKVEYHYDDVEAMLKQVIHYQNMKAAVEHMYDGFTDGVQSVIDRFPTKEEYDVAYSDTLAIEKEASRFPGGIRSILDFAKNLENRELFANMLHCEKVLYESARCFNDYLKRNSDIHSENWIQDEEVFCDYLSTNQASLKDWALYSSARIECLCAGLKPVVDAYEAGMQESILNGAYKKGFYYALINHVIFSDDVLSCFSGATFNESIAQFKKLDEDMIERTKREIFHLLAANMPASWDSNEIGMEMNLLRKAIGSNGRGMSIRELFSRIPHILLRLCPCMLMSPNSVAQYLEQKNELFDVVIFDEASQLPTCKAVGALYRAKSAVIVGDPKQMPPTSFFAGSGLEVDDFALADLDSILDDALALGIPSQYLQWHYRSTHESLIAFSNHQFYENKMYTFPSANDRERHVSTVHVDGVYVKSTNAKEAEAIVEEVIRRYHDPELKEQSIGIVAFNIKQRDLIDNLLTKQFQNDAGFEQWANREDDPLFVKNLENVQGDERDAILFSIGYGPNENGKVLQSFGPINMNGGGKRLNVAFSRARISMTIFTSMYASDIKITESSSDGVIAFRDFLKYAEGNDLHTESNKEAVKMLSKAGIMQNICKEIHSMGLECETLVGHSDFHVDIAVVDPYEPTRFMFGILLDGEGYQKTKNTRDREVAQIAVLKNLGWELCRVWTIDWWDNRDKEIKKLRMSIQGAQDEAKARFEKIQAEKERLEAEAKEREIEIDRVKEELQRQTESLLHEEESVEKTVEEDSGDSIKETHSLTEVAKMSSEPVEEVTPITVPKIQAEPVTEAKTKTTSEVKSVVEPVAYQSVEKIVSVMGAEWFTTSTGKKEIVRVIEKIIETEAPILKDVLMKKVFTVFGVSKSAASVEAYEKALKSSKTKNTKSKGIVVCWRQDQDPKEYRGIRISSERSIDEIPPHELSNAVVYVLQKKGPMTKDQLLKETSIVFGYKRLGKNMETVMISGVLWAKAAGMIELVNGKYQCI